MSSLREEPMTNQTLAANRLADESIVWRKGFNFNGLRAGIHFYFSTSYRNDEAKVALFG